MQIIRRVPRSLTIATGASPVTMRNVVHVAMCVMTFIASMAIAVFGAHAADDADPHAHHHMMMPEITRTVVDYAVPDVRLVRDDGKPVVLAEELDDGRPVVMSFIYTSCTTICPITSQTLAELQKQLGTSRDRVHIVSITIDPEQDTPARLRDYARKFGAGPEWQHYTGSLAGIVASEKAFDVYHGDKMSHTAVTLIRVAPGRPWVRIDGFATASDIYRELHDVVASK